MLIDAHAHLNFKDFERDWEKVIERSLAHNVWMLNVGSNYQTSKKAVEIAENYKKGVFAAIGLHPIHARDLRSLAPFKELSSSKTVKAIGEIGLDYYKDYGSFKEEQRKVFLEQISLAQELDLPVIFHCRKAHKDLIKELRIKNYELRINGVVHCFTGKWKQAKQYLDMGFYLGFNGIIYKMDLREVIEKTPLEKILIETDCPFLTPPQAGVERNEPIFVKYIAQDIARIRNISYQEIIETTTKNAKVLFKI